MNQQRTSIVVRPAARGGKYLGHDAANLKNQSALVALIDPATHKIVAHGYAIAPDAMSAGPKDLMAPVSRASPFAADSNTVAVTLSVKISEPTDFTLLVYGPLKHPDQARLAQAQITLLPGVDVGIQPQYPEGLVIEIPGLCVSGVKADWSGTQVTCFAKVTMMCGCPIRNPDPCPYWPWPATDFSVQLVTCMQSGAVCCYTLGFDNADPLASSFSGQWANQAAKGDQVAAAWIYAFEPKLGNMGKYRILPASTVSHPEIISELLAAGIFQL